MSCQRHLGILAIGLTLVGLHMARAATRPVTPEPSQSDLQFINTGFENASPLQWTVEPDGTVHVYMLYDYERSSPNRAAGHWHFQIQAKSGSDLALVLHNFDNVYNGRPGAAVSDKTICFASADGRTWKALPTEKLEGSTIRVHVHVESDSLYLARLEPYRLSDLDRFLDEIRGNRLVQIADIGKTVEGRPLEMIRVGNAQAEHQVVLRARAHAWEPGGNWVVQGLIRSLLRDDEVSRRCLARYCVYVMPMANKDGVARGRTRFNLLGKDLNRNWDKLSDPKLAPENHALETWIQGMVERGRRPDLLIDLHNDDDGGLHISRPQIENLGRHLDRMRLFEQLLRKHTWFTEGNSGANFRNPGTIGEGLLERYGIDACILELNANWIAGLKQPPSGKAWEQFGQQLREVFFECFEQADPGPRKPDRTGEAK